MIFGFLRKAFSARAKNRGAVVIGDRNVVVTGVIQGDFVVANGERYNHTRLNIPWISSPVLDNVGSLLTWSSRIPRKLHGRNAELEDLYSWARKPAGSEQTNVRVRVLYGEGGAGKTRLAFELAERLRLEGWRAGQVNDPTQPVAFPLSKDGVLLIIDYPERFPGAVTQLLGLLKRSELPGLHLRVLFLCRNASVMEAIISAEAEVYRSPALELKPFAAEEAAWELFKDAWHEMRQRLGASRALQLSEAAFRTWLQRSVSHAQPLIMVAFALNLLYDPAATELGRTEILRRLAFQERIRILKEFEKHHPQKKEGALLLKALAAIPGALQAAEVNRLHEQLSYPGIQLPTAMDLQGSSLWQEGMLKELQPDLLASVFLHDLLAEWLSDATACGCWIWAVLNVGTPSRIELRSRLNRIARLSVDRPRLDTQKTAANPLVEALARLVEGDEEKATLIDTVLNMTAKLEWTLPLLAVSAGRAVARKLEKLTQEDFPVHAPVLASTLNNLSVRLPEFGDRVGGLAAIQRAVEIYEALAKENFVLYAPDLASSLNNLSVDLATSGDRAGGLATIRRAVDIREALAKENFARYGADLASSLNNLSLRLTESGDRAGGLATIRRSVEIYEALAEENFAVYASDLARALNNLSIRLPESGDRAGGLAAIQRAVDIREALAKENFAAYAPDLASSLNNLSVDLADFGNRAGGLATIRRAVEIYEALAKENFAAYASDLARALNNLALRLHEFGDRAGGLLAIQRAVEIREALAKENLAAYAPDLARSLYVLSKLLGQDPDRTEEAAAILQRAVEMLRPLVIQDTGYFDLYTAMTAALSASQA